MNRFRFTTEGLGYRVTLRNGTVLGHLEQLGPTRRTWEWRCECLARGGRTDDRGFRSRWEAAVDLLAHAHARGELEPARAS